MPKIHDSSSSISQIIRLGPWGPERLMRAQISREHYYYFAGLHWNDVHV